MTYIYEIYSVGDGYETFNTVIGYADNEDKADELIEQAKIFNPYLKYNKREVKVNFLFTEPFIRKC